MTRKQPAISINSDGGIIIDSTVVIDGHEDLVPRIVTHIHSDHTRRLRTSLQKSNLIIGTPLTLEWLKVLGFKIPHSKILPLNYDQSIELGELRISLGEANHIPGTAQVIVETANQRIVYTSDFKKPGKRTPILNADTLVIDAVYGDPAFQRPFDDYIDEVLTDLIRELLAKGPVYVYGYYGKVQEVMDILRRNDLDAPFILSHKQYVLAKVAERFGMNFGDYLHANSKEAEDVMRDGWYVYFTHLTASRRAPNGLGNHVLLSGWEFSRPFKRLGSRRWLVAFSDHADFMGLVKYVEEAKPEQVIVNIRRSTAGEKFGDYVAKKLGVKVKLLP